jgi:hypothetical protein
MKWILKRHLIILTFQEAKCFSKQKQKDLVEGDQAHISVQGGTGPHVFPIGHYHTVMA